jgi:hypothetical protein
MVLGSIFTVCKNGTNLLFYSTTTRGVDGESDLTCMMVTGWGVKRVVHISNAALVSCSLSPPGSGMPPCCSRTTIEAVPTTWDHVGWLSLFFRGQHGLRWRLHTKIYVFTPWCLITIWSSSQVWPTRGKPWLRSVQWHPCLTVPLSSASSRQYSRYDTFFCFVMHTPADSDIAAPNSFFRSNRSPRIYMHCIITMFETLPVTGVLCKHKKSLQIRYVKFTVYSKIYTFT